MSPAAINSLVAPIKQIDNSPLPEIVYLDELPESSMFQWHWETITQRAIKERVLLVTKDPNVYHALRRSLPKKSLYRVRRRNHEMGFVYQIADAKQSKESGPITTRSMATAQASNHGVFLKIANELIAGGASPAGFVCEVEDFKSAATIRTLVYTMRKAKRLKVGIALRVKQPDGTYLPLKQVPAFKEKRVTIFSFPVAKQKK